MFLRSEFGLVAAAVFVTISAAPSEPIYERDVVVRNIDPCVVDKHVVELHEKYNTGLLPKKVEDCIVTQLGPTFMNAFYSSYDATDNSVKINGEKVTIDGSIVGNNNKDNIVGDDNIKGDHNVLVDGDGNAVAQIKGDGDNIVGTGNGNGNGNIDHSNVNNTNEDSNNDSKISVDLDHSLNNNTVKDNANKQDIDVDVDVKDNLNNNTIDADSNSHNNLPPYTPPYTPVAKRDVVSCFSFKYLTSVNNLLPCIFTAISRNNPQALLQCGVSKTDICASASCLPEGIQEYVTDLCTESSSPIHVAAVTSDLADPSFHESSDNNVRAFLGLLTQSELTAIRNYETTHAKKTGVESSCILGSRCGDENACCLGTCGVHNGQAKCYGII